MSEDTYGLINEPPEEDSGYTPATPISEDLPCLSCGYNLRGLSDDRACPECGTAVGRSILDDRLRYSNPLWVRKLASGANWLLWSVIAGIVFAVFAMVIGFVMVGRSGNNPATMPQYAEMLVELISLLPALLYIVGIWLITSPEPGVIESSDWSLRSILRWTAVFSCVINAIEIAIPESAAASSGVVSVTGSLCGLVGYIALFVYARRLALRVPDYELAGQTKTVMWGIIVSLLGIILFTIIGLVFGISSGGSGFAVAWIPVCVFGVAYLVFLIWSLVLLVRYRRVANYAANDAERTWARGLATS